MPTCKFIPRNAESAVWSVSNRTVHAGPRDIHVDIDRLSVEETSLIRNNVYVCFRAAY